ncbi:MULTISPECIES: ABC transporter permease [Phocaeicola]|uniref:ABC transporter permease n=1 Tax=Phocaeicola plebeius TaxID=310297 RepID=A0A3E4ZD92_9BACT|nr:ABC transporter permease [Phocaeicola plebeius]RGM93015.1 ABC transporter permease [Phocaeicola plebeius]RHD58135.1 ABC transporter permease [Phocaeicola plebeius]RHL00050.1 ABC transporter permease [Phocaeicola plebeius]RHL18280.1 ABC transporter permease [Phocaeicola plebeius]
MTELIQEIYGTIMRNKLRALLTGFSVAWGIFMLIVLLGAGNGLIHAFENQSKGMIMNSMKIYPGTTSQPYKGMKEGRSIYLKESDRELTATSFPDHIIHTGATVSKGDVILTYGKEAVSIGINGVFPNYPSLEAIKIKEGRFVNVRDMEERRKIIVLHEKTVKNLFPHTSPIGKYLNAQGVSYQVVGIYTDQNSFSPSALVPFTTLQTIYQKGDSIDNITFTTKGLTNEATNEQFEAEYRQALGLKKQFSPTDEGAIWIWNRFTQYLQQQTATQILHTAIWVIGIFTLLSGIVGVSNIMLITVRERTHEFGIRKALGAKPASILWLIISESVTITTFFGYIGMVAGIAVTEYMNQVAGKQTMNMGVFSMTFFENPTVDLSIAIEATLTLVIAGTLAGLFPARKAARIRPIEALRAD